MRFCTFCIAVIAALLLGCASSQAAEATAAVEQWGVFEASFTGPQEGNPFVDVELSATFQQGDKPVPVTGFYDGGGVYRVRFMPATAGEWSYHTRSNCKELNGKTGTLTVSPASAANHGPVRVQDVYRFAYADGTPYREIGTTC